MGYRSDIAYVIKFKDIETRDAFVTLMHAKNDEHTNTALREVEYKYSAQPIITFFAEGHKWYEPYPDVRAHHALMSDAESLYEAEWRFVRVGEEAGDIETQSGVNNDYELWEYVDPVSSIRANFPSPDDE